MQILQTEWIVSDQFEHPLAPEKFLQNSIRNATEDKIK